MGLLFVRKSKYNEMKAARDHWKASHDAARTACVLACGQRDEEARRADDAEWEAGRLRIAMKRMAMVAMEESACKELSPDEMLEEVTSCCRPASAVNATGAEV